MKRLLLKILLFLIPIILVSPGLDYLLSGVLKRSYSYADGEYPTWNDLYAGKINSDIVIYGSSRAWVHINPRMISDSLKTTAYNLGINGHDFRLQYFRHLLLLENNSKPKLIIQNLDVGTLFKLPDLYNPDQFLPYMLHNKQMKHATIAFNGYHSYDYEIPLIRYYGKKEAIIHILKILIHPSANVPMRIRGYQAQDSKWNDDLEKAIEKMGSYRVILDSSIIHLFENYLNECRQNNIKIILAYSPEFIEGQKFVSNRSEIIELYNQISKKYDIPFYDYSTDTISYRRQYFYNSGHMNKKGAELFTAKLIDELRQNRQSLGF
jgi:hypothetical protein